MCRNNNSYTCIDLYSVQVLLRNSTVHDDKSIELLAKQKEERKVDEQMKFKQKDFSERMESCAVRRNQLKKSKEKVICMISLGVEYSIIHHNLWTIA